MRRIFGVVCLFSSKIVSVTSALGSLILAPSASLTSVASVSPFISSLIALVSSSPLVILASASASAPSPRVCLFVLSPIILLLLLSLIFLFILLLLLLSLNKFFHVVFLFGLRLSLLLVCEFNTV